MMISGRVQNGVVVPDGNAHLPEGAQVCITLVPSSEQVTKRPVQLPLVTSEKPGSIHLTNQRIAEILEDEDAAS